ncbi:MAG: acyl-CoA dehydrogenase family protein [Vicinamibacteria bacterium]
MTETNSGSNEAGKNVSELEARKVAEAARETTWKHPSFVKELFLGNFRLDLIHPYPMTGDERPEFKEYYQRFKTFLKTEVNPAEIDRTGEYPEHVLDGLRKLGAFGMKIPKEYGGLGFTNVEYNRIMKLLGTYCGNIGALLSAHQSIGVPQPLKLFGTPEQKKKYLPRCAKGDISAFALTELGVGSDPARVTTTAEKTADGTAYILNGKKLWTTNGTLAKLLVVMASDPKTHKISAFIVETEWKGVVIENRCRFMGLKALANAVIAFDNVRVPVENLVGEEGRGLKIALTTLNDGRLSIPNISAGTAKAALETVRIWAASRVQWGRPVGRHEAVGHKIADMAATAFAMESLVELATQMSDRGGADIRLEAAAAKEWNSARGWEIVDDLMQIRGGRGYETEGSLEARGESPIPVERLMRDFRINKIFEGSSEIMHLFMAREAVDKHLDVAGALVEPGSTLGDKAKALPKIAAFYSWWYPTRFLGWGHWPRFAEFGGLAKHVRFVDRRSRKLSRSSFHGMALYQAGLQNKQAFLFRLVDIVNDLFAMSATCARAQALVNAKRPEAKEAVELADLFCRNASRKVDAAFKALWSNDDSRKYGVAKRVLDGRHVWLENELMGISEAYSSTKPEAAEQARAVA